MCSTVTKDFESAAQCKYKGPVPLDGIVDPLRLDIFDYEAQKSISHFELNAILTVGRDKAYTRRDEIVTKAWLDKAQEQNEYCLQQSTCIHISVSLVRLVHSE